MKLKSLQVRIVLLVFLCLIFVVGALVFYGIIYSSQRQARIQKDLTMQAEKTAKEEIVGKARAGAFEVKAELQNS